MDLDKLQLGVPLAPFTMLRAGGPAERFAVVRSVDQLASLATLVHGSGSPLMVLGWGSNVLPSDAGVPGVVAINQATEIEIRTDGQVVADSGIGFQDLFLKTAQAGLTGLAFAVGIPGTLGGALVSNAGAYRSSIGDFITGLEVVQAGERKWVSPEVMAFAYRDSVLRREDPPELVVLRVRLNLHSGSRKKVYDDAREFQRQRISKQPPSPSAGSFFKNIHDADLARALPDLADSLKHAGVVPAGYLCEACGLKGKRIGGAMVGRRHANFLLNVRNATATEIRTLAESVKAHVFARFGVQLEEEVLYLGDWRGFASAV